MKSLFLLFFLFISLSALYLYFASYKEGIRSKPFSFKKMAANAQKEYKMNQKTNKRLESANK